MQDNGPHQGAERSDIHWSTNFLRQCKGSNFEGGIRVPGMMHVSALIPRLIIRFSLNILYKLTGNIRKNE